MRDFLLQSFGKHLPWFRCGGKGEHLNLASRQNPALNQLTTNVLQDFQRLHPWFRSLAGLECRGMQMYPGGTSGRGIHQTRNRTAYASEPKPNSKKPLQHIDRIFIARFQQASPPVQMQRKKKYLNLTARQNPALNQLTTNALQDFQQLHPWFRSLTGLEHHRTQIRPRGTSGRGIHQTRNRTAHASEPELNPRNSLQHIEKLSIAEFHQASSLVQMQRKRVASEPCHKAESSSQLTHSKRVARFSATAPVVQIPTGSGMPRNANVPWRHFWQGYPPNAQQNGPSI